MPYASPVYKHTGGGAIGHARSTGGIDLGTHKAVGKALEMKSLVIEPFLDLGCFR